MKSRLFQKLQQIIENRIYITASELSKEIRENMRCVGLGSQALAVEISIQEMKTFLSGVKQNRQC